MQLDKTADPVRFARIGNMMGLARTHLSRPTSVLMATMVGTLAVRMVSSIILTRLLAPAVYGQYGLIMSYFVVLAMLTDLGFQAYIVRHERGDEPHFRDVLWTLHITRGVILTVIAIVTAPMVSVLLDKPEIALPLAVTALMLAIDGASSIAQLASLRHNGANKLSLIDFFVGISQTIITIALAFWLRSIWAIVGGQICASLIKTALSYALFDNSFQKFRSDPEVRREFFAFSKVVMASGAVTLLMSQSDKFVLGRLFSLDMFGLYALATTFAAIPLQFAQNYVSRIVYPAYAKTWNYDKAKLPEVYYAVRQKTSLLVAIGGGALIGIAPLLMRVLYDPRYEGAALFLSLLGVSAVLRMPNLCATEFMTAIGKIKYTIYTNLVRVAWLIAGGFAGYMSFGGLGVVMAVGLMEVPAMVFSWVFLRREGVLDLRKELLYIALVAAAAFAAAEVSSFAMAYIITH